MQKCTNGHERTSPDSSPQFTIHSSRFVQVVIVIFLRLGDWYDSSLFVPVVIMIFLGVGDWYDSSLSVSVNSDSGDPNIEEMQDFQYFH